MTAQTNHIADIDFADPAFLVAPWPELLRLQREDPIHWSDRHQGWVISRHADVKAAYADRRLSSARGNQLFGGLSEEMLERLETTIKYNALNVNRLDGRDHIRIRSLMMKAFSNATVSALAPMIGQVADDLLDAVRPGEIFDFHRQIASVLPTRVIQHMLGIPAADQRVLFKLATDFTAATGALNRTPELLLALDASIRTMNAIFNDLIAEREKSPGNDLISILVHARDGLNRLSHDELLACFHSIIIAGVETTAVSLGIQLVELIRRPELVRRVAQGPDQAFPVVTELLRYPGTVKCMTRLAGEDFEWEGRSIRKGDLVWIMNAGANVDPEVFDHAEQVDPDRDNGKSMAFGPGLHHCVGHLLTRIELSQFLSRAFSRFDISLGSEELELVPSYIFRGYRALPVVFNRR